mmetsp:Transcript_18612/g.51985  ORF Transcript_18612/g.51985 Transcript_18612/m.51985 type:complete len:210 (+) Transcript_18612:617-1246(+)
MRQHGRRLQPVALLQRPEQVLLFADARLGLLLKRVRGGHPPRGSSRVPAALVLQNAVSGRAARVSFAVLLHGRAKPWPGAGDGAASGHLGYRDLRLRRLRRLQRQEDELDIQHPDSRSATLCCADGCERRADGDVGQHRGFCRGLGGDRSHAGAVEERLDGEGRSRRCFLSCAPQGASAGARSSGRRLRRGGLLEELYDGRRSAAVWIA